MNANDIKSEVGKNLKFDEIENSLLDFNRGMNNLLKHSEVYFILDLVKRLVKKNEDINYLENEIKEKVKYEMKGGLKE